MATMEMGNASRARTSSSTNLTTFSVSLWIRPVTLPTTTTAFRIALFSNGFVLDNLVETSIHKVRVRSVGTSTISTIQANSSFTANQNHHIVVTHDANTIRLYINGVQPTAGVASTPPTLTGGFHVCEETSGQDGEYGDVRVYDRILTPDDVLTIYNARGKDSYVKNMVIRWLFDELTTGTNFATGNVIDRGTLKGSVTITGTTTPKGGRGLIPLGKRSRAN